MTDHTAEISFCTVSDCDGQICLDHLSVPSWDFLYTYLLAHVHSTKKHDKGQRKHFRYVGRRWRRAARRRTLDSDPTGTASGSSEHVSVITCTAFRKRYKDNPSRV